MRTVALHDCLDYCNILELVGPGLARAGFPTLVVPSTSVATTLHLSLPVTTIAALSCRRRRPLTCHVKHYPEITRAAYSEYRYRLSLLRAYADESVR